MDASGSLYNSFTEVFALSPIGLLSSCEMHASLAPPLPYMCEWLPQCPAVLAWRAGGGTGGKRSRDGALSRPEGPSVQ